MNPNPNPNPNPREGSYVRVKNIFVCSDPSCVTIMCCYTLYAHLKCTLFYVHPRYILVHVYIIRVCIYVHLYIPLTHSLSNTPLTAPLYILGTWCRSAILRERSVVPRRFVWRLWRTAPRRVRRHWPEWRCVNTLFEVMNRLFKGVITVLLRVLGSFRHSSMCKAVYIEY